MKTASLSRTSFWGRLGTYLAEMFPVHIRLGEAFLLAGSFLILLEWTLGYEADVFSLATLVGALSVFLLLLTLRLMDELKDLQIDLQLFRDRPLPSGQVRRSDIRIALASAATAFLAINLLVGSAFWSSVLVMGYAFLMFRYFFIPEMLRRNLLLNLATHNPVVPLMLGYLVAVLAAERGIAIPASALPNVLLLVLGYWGMMFAWEIARKIRSEEEENEYVTYSRLLGRRGAVAVAAGAQAVTVIACLHLSQALSLSVVFPVLVLAGYGIVLFGHIRFLVRPSPRTSRLRPLAEAFILSVFAAVGVEYLITLMAR
jgi:4-hydroxybenzoate polyprenyltransferase